jgi:prefoldin alpha subunit
VLVPLTASLYVPGKIRDTAKVLVDVGTGYYIEMDTAKAKGFYERKVAELEQSLKELEKILNQKVEMGRGVEEVMKAKVLAGEGRPPAGPGEGIQA